MAYCTRAQLKTYLDIQNSDTFTADADADTVTVTKPRIQWTTGDAVMVSTTGALPGGLAASTVYYVIVVADLTLKLASSSALAGAGTAIDLTSAGTGVHTLTKQLNVDDDLLDDLIGRAQDVIEYRTGRVFEASANTERSFDAVADVVGRLLKLDADLCSIDSITNGDGTELSSSDYVTEPRNETPYWGIRLKANSSESWTYSGAPEDAITISGKWAFSASAPEAIVHATVRLAAYFYRQRDAQVFDVTAVPEMGQLAIPQGIPADVRRVIDRPPFKRVRV